MNSLRALPGFPGYYLDQDNRVWSYKKNRRPRWGQEITTDWLKLVERQTYKLWDAEGTQHKVALDALIRSVTGSPISMTLPALTGKGSPPEGKRSIENRDHLLMRLEELEERVSQLEGLWLAAKSLTTLPEE